MGPTIRHFGHAELEGQLPHTFRRAIVYHDQEEVGVGICWQTDAYLVPSALGHSSVDVRILLGDSIPFPYTLILVGKDAGLHKDTGSQVEDDGEEEGNVTEAIALQQMEVDICGMVRYQALRMEEGRLRAKLD